MASNVRHSSPGAANLKIRSIHPGFERFKVALKPVLTFTLILELAGLFGYSDALVNEIKNAADVALLMIMSMERGGQINRNNISPLLAALKEKKHHDTARLLKGWFNKYVSNSEGWSWLRTSRLRKDGIEFKMADRGGEEDPLLQKAKKERNTLETAVSDNVLWDLSTQISGLWRFLARELKIPLEILDSIGSACPDDVTTKCYRTLLYWKENSDNPSKQVLDDARQKMNIDRPTEDRFDSSSDKQGYDKVHPVTEKQRRKYSSELPGMWRYLGGELHLPKNVLDNIAIEISRGAVNRCHDVLRQWEQRTSEQPTLILEQAQQKVNEIYTGLEERLVRALKKTYKKQYDAIQPILYIRDRLYCIDRIFVEGGVKVLVAGLWERLTSYQDILKDEGATLLRVIEGGPGYGKSTLALEFAYDWGEGIEGSSVENVSILIVLRLRQLGGVQSIYKAIKWFLLSEENVKVSDIEAVIGSCLSVKIILDGHDEYPDRDPEDQGDIRKIVMRKMFQNLNVSLTTRYLSENYDQGARIYKLTGFDDRARDEYIRRVVVGNDGEQAVRRVMRRLEDNPILSDLCDVPLIFVMFAHMAHEKEDFQKFKSVTEFIRYMISCFHHHLLNKIGDINVAQMKRFENGHALLDRMAFDGLSKEHPQLSWSEKEVRRRIGDVCCEYYLRLGVLVKEDVTASVVEIRFYHTLFCEWYAAHHLARLLTGNWNPSVLEYAHPYDYQYLYRFACGLSQDSSERLINYLRSLPGGDKFTILCLLEQTGDQDKFIHVVRDLCKKTLKISEDDNKLMQRTTLQILEVASSNSFPTACLQLDGCLSEEVTAGGNLLLNSGLHVPPLSTLETIEIIARNSPAIPEKKMMGLLAFAGKCELLKNLTFEGKHLLPLSVPATQIPSSLKTRNIKVLLPSLGGLVYRLNLIQGEWVKYGSGAVWIGRVDMGHRNQNEWIVRELTRASAAGIHISHLFIGGCRPVADESGSSLALGSQLSLPILSTLQKLWIADRDRRFTNEEVVGILGFTVQCAAMKELVFCGAFAHLPDRVRGAEPILPILRSRNVTVKWDVSFSPPKYLNLFSGQWE